MGKVIFKNGIDPRKHTAEQTLEKFLSKVEITDTCWIWKGLVIPNGYGYMSYNVGYKRNEKAHRVSYELFNSPLIKGMVIMHSCDNPLCVNPKHLIHGTQKQNLEDCARKGRKNYNRVRKSKCRRGHDMIDETNVRWSKDKNNRYCLACARMNDKKQGKKKVERARKLRIMPTL